MRETPPICAVLASSYKSSSERLITQTHLTAPSSRNITQTFRARRYERQIINIARNHSRQSYAWLDISGFPAANETYANYPDVTINVWSGCYSGNWQDDTGQLTNAGMHVIVSGPFYITQQNGAPTTPHFTWKGEIPCHRHFL